MKIKFTIPGPAQAKQRPRVNRNTGRIYTPGATSKYEKLVKESYGDNPCFEDQFISVKRFNDSLSDIFIDIKIIREATKEEEYLYEKRWQLKDILKKC